MISLDGVMQAPGGREEDPSQNFEYGGWTAPYGDKAFGEAMQKELQPADYILGRKTFDIWENYWPEHGDFWPAINEGTKYVLSGTRDKSDWENTVFIKNLADIQKIKTSQGRDIHVWGSSKVVHLLLEHDLVDELRLKIYPLLLGKGKKLFGDEAHASAFELTESSITTKGVILASYKRAGKVETGNVGPE
jgi:dihydrofolate reductase